VTWDSKKKTLAERTLIISECQLIIGMSAGNFTKKKKYLDLYTPSLCCSFLAPQRSLDVVFLHQSDMELWLTVLPRAGILKINDPSAKKEGRKSTIKKEIVREVETPPRKASRAVEKPNGTSRGGAKKKDSPVEKKSLDDDDDDRSRNSDEDVDIRDL
jgi:hypothetical protein